MVVGMNLVGKAVRNVFDRHCPNPKAPEGESADESPYADILGYFNSGHHIDLNDEDDDSTHSEKLRAVGGLAVLAKSCFEPESDVDCDAAMEVVLEGLHQHNLLAREATDMAFRYTDMLATMLRGDSDN